jgi:hypothetical protein
MESERSLDMEEERLYDGFLSDLWLLFLDGTGGMRLFDCCVVFDMEQGR